MTTKTDESAASLSDPENISFSELATLMPSLFGENLSTTADSKGSIAPYRAIHGFGIGDVAKEGDCVCESGWTDDYLAAHPEEDKRLPVGFTANTLDDAKRMAIAFADSVG